MIASRKNLDLLLRSVILYHSTSYWLLQFNWWKYLSSFRASSDLQTVTNLKSILLTESLYLIDVPTKSSSTVDTIQEQIYWTLISLTIFFCLCSIAIFVIYLIRTRRLVLNFSFRYRSKYLFKRTKTFLQFDKKDK